MSIVRRAAYRSRDLLFPASANHVWRRRVQGTVRSLVYHRVGVRDEFGFLDEEGAASIDPDSLRRDLAFLRDQGARFLTFSDLRQGQFPEAGEFGVIVSFDDGTRDVYEHGLPVLQSMGIRGVVFQISSLVDASTLLWEHLLYWLWQQPASRKRLQAELAEAARVHGFEVDAFLPSWLRLMARVDVLQSAMDRILEPAQREAAAAIARRLYPDSAQLRAAADFGHELGSHGHGHFARHSLDAKLFEQELSQSKSELEGILGRAVEAYSHPYNMHSAEDRALLGKYFRQVATVDSAPILRGTDPLAMPRYNWPGEFRNGLRWRRWLWTGE